MNRTLFIFLLGLFSTLLTKAVTYDVSDSFDDYEVFDLDMAQVNDQFEGLNWLKSKLTTQTRDLNGIYQSKMFKRTLSNKSEVRRIQKSYSSWVEERICLESPYIDKPVRANMTSRFGYRTHPISGRHHVHAGIDFRGNVGTPVLAGAAGKVKTSRRKGAYGKTIIIDHGNSYTTLYGHLSDYAVKEGQWVNLGQTIGYIGKTGRATGPHLHFEVRCHNVPLNPSKYLGHVGQMAEVKFNRQSKSYQRQPTFVKRDPNYYTRMINLEKLKRLNSVGSRL